MIEKEYKRLRARVRKELKAANKCEAIPAISRDTGVSDGALRRIGSGSTVRPRVVTLELLAEYFGV